MPSAATAWNATYDYEATFEPKLNYDICLHIMSMF